MPGVLYLRKSKGRAGIGRQRTTGTARAAKCGVQIIAEYVDVDRTAYQKVGGARPKRDGFADMLAQLRSSGRDNPITVVAWHADRLNRSSADVEDLIEVCAAGMHPVETVRGGRYELWTATGRKRIRADAVDAAYEVDHLIERLTEMKSEAANAGRWLGGRRPFGFEPDGVTVREDEAREIARGADAVLSGVSLISQTRDLNARGVRTSTGRPWEMSQWRRVLLRPRNAGLMEWQGEVVGHAEWGRWMDDDETMWGCILSEYQWRALRRILLDPDRRTTSGPERKWLGSGIYRCGLCGQTLIVSLASGRNRRRWRVYRCRGHGAEKGLRRHVARRVDVVDDYVTEALTAYLGRPEAATLFAQPDTVQRDRVEWQRKAAWLRARLDEQAELHAQGVIDGSQLAAGSARLRADLEQAQARLARLTSTSVVGDLAGNPRAADIWPDLPLSRQRAILDTVMTVTILPAGRGRQPGGGYFDPESVRIEWRS